MSKLVRIQGRRAFGRGTDSAKALGQALSCGRESRPVSRGRESQRVEKEQKLLLDVTLGDTGSHRRV